MSDAIGQSLPVAVGVMVSPLPIVAVVLMAVLLLGIGAKLVGDGIVVL